MEPVEMASVTTDQLEQALLKGEATVARIRATQMRLLSEVDSRQVPIGDGARTLHEWAAARMDLSPETAQRLTQAARRLQDQPALAAEFQEGNVSFDRVAEESRLVAAGADREVVALSRGWDIAGLRRMTARYQRIRRSDEQQVFRERFLSIQPALDESSYKLWGLLPGADGRLVEQALQQRADQFPALPDRKQCSRTQRQADALVSIAQDSLDGTTETTTTSIPLVSIFLDGQLAATTNGEKGAEIACGPRIGPLTLEQILCEGQVEILAAGQNGKPLAVGPTSRTIPPKLRRFILHRDGGACTADGCQSRYRLQPPPHQAKIPRRVTRPRQPHHLVLVPPPRRHPPQRPSNRPRLTTATQTIPQTQQTRTTLTQDFSPLGPASSKSTDNAPNLHEVASARPITQIDGYGAGAKGSFSSGLIERFGLPIRL